METAKLDIISASIIGAAIEVHRLLGPGLLENVYQEALMTELRLHKFKVEKQVPIPCIYKGIKLDCAYRADLIVEDSVIVELKATENDLPVFAKQLTTYLRIADKRLGLLINFNKERLIDGLKRVVNNF